MRTNRYAATTVAAVALALSTGTAFAQGERACEAMTLYSPEDHREAHFVDLGDAGLSVGDRRIGHRGVFDEAGNRVAERVWSTTVIELNDEGEAALTVVEHMTVFDDGVLFVTFGNRMASDTANPDNTHLPSNTTHSILGGSGAFSGAQGTMDLLREGDDFTYVFNLECG